jgi:hypothetical protein
MPGIVHQGSVRAQQGKIDPPGIDADSIQGDFSVPAANSQRVANFVIKPERVPIKPSRELHRSIVKTVQLFELQFSRVESAQDGPPALGAQVDRKKPVHAGNSIASLPIPSRYSARV